MVDFRKIQKFADIFGDLAGVENMIWDGNPPVFDQSQQQQPQSANFGFQQPQQSVQLSDRSRKMISQLEPVFQEKATQLLLRGLAAGLRPEIVEGLRSQERQNELFEQGRSEPGQIVTKTKNSMHTRGLAIDIAQLDENGEITYEPDDPSFWEKMGQIGRSLGLRWGGDFKSFKDLPHFQYQGQLQ